MAMLTGRFDKGLTYSNALHRASGVELGTRGISLALLRTALVLDDGGDEDEAIAALLIGLAGMFGTKALASEIHWLFGSRVAAIVENCAASDYRIPTVAHENAMNLCRKLASQLTDSLRVALADCTANALTTHPYLGLNGQDRKNESSEHPDSFMLQYYDLLARVFCSLFPGAMAERFDWLVADLKAVASSSVSRIP